MANNVKDSYIPEGDLLQQRIGSHVMWLDRRDVGISRVLRKRSQRKWPREAEFMDLIVSEVKPGMVAFDLGANIGFVTMVLAQLVGSEGWVYAVEPSPRNFQLLQKNIQTNGYQNRVHSFQLAISNADGMGSFYLSNASNLHGIRNSNHTVESIQVRMCTGSTFFQDKEPPNFIKMDIEGAEVEALEGMLDLLTQAPSPVKILIETHPMYYNEEHSFEKQLLALFDAGFHVKYVITGTVAEPEFFSRRGYKPMRIYRDGNWPRGVYKDISESDVLEALQPDQLQETHIPLVSCLKRPWLLMNRRIRGRIVRGLFLEK